jgi:hypothetical protein
VDVAVVEHLPHALEVLVDAYPHELDLQAELVELLVEDRAQRNGSRFGRGHRRPPGDISRTAP